MHKGFSKDQHQTMGQQAKVINALLTELYVAVSTAYGKSSQKSKDLEAALQRLNRSRSSLDDDAVAKGLTTEVWYGRL